MSINEDHHHSNEVMVVRGASYYHQKSLTPNKNEISAPVNSGSQSLLSNISSANMTQISAKTSSSTTTNINNNNNININSNKKHNIGFHLRRLFFGSNTGNSSLVKSNKLSKDSEAGENKNFIKHNNPSLHSSSSETSNENRFDSKRKRNPIRKPDNWTSNNTSLFSSNQNSYECSICLLEQPLFKFPELKTCQHRACINCLRQYLRIEISESRINITCLQCQELMHPNDIKAILKNDSVLIEKYESFMVRRTLITDPDARWCPAPDCEYCVIATGCASCPMLRCERPGCETLFCYHCKQEWHPNQTCDQARAQRGLNKSVFINSPNPTKTNVTFTSRGTDSFMQTQHASTSIDFFAQRDDIKPCPCCKVLIIKMNDGSCNHMTCSFCGTEFCWLCMQKISDLHYLSPSGCTFWGKKPWSRKKKIMWQLGMLVGAPVGIALIAGIAVPAIIIGIPVWVGRKLYSRFERNHMSRHKSNFLVTTGVLTSIFVSPILAAIAVGIGVPILLAYVYGVVPISLCRSGGCGVTTSSSGVRIELDEDEITAPDGVSVDTALSGRGVTNPSIGEVSLGMSASLSIGSSSHLDRVVLDIQPDRESSSIAACAGSITSNYTNVPINSQTVGQKLETVADINSNKRLSLSSQNADSSSVTLSFGERSVNTNPSLIEESSMKTNTGSLLETPMIATNFPQLSSPVEVHIIGRNIKGSNSNQHIQYSTKLPAQESQPSNKCQGDVSRGNVQVPTNHSLNKFESRSMEYLSNNYCNICHKSHKPCCPNFQHPIGDKSIKIGTKGKKPKTIEITKYHSNKNENKSSMTTGNSKYQDAYNHEKFKHLLAFQMDSQIGKNNISNTLSKKAMSQIFYPSNYGKDRSMNNQNEKFSKSNLSHSLSFTTNNLL